jgi:hypothetical protein
MAVTNTIAMHAKKNEYSLTLQVCTQHTKDTSMSQKLFFVFALMYPAFSASAAHAAKLADGFRGIPFGVLPEKPPFDTCVSQEKGYVCRFDLGEVKDVSLIMLNTENIYYGYLVAVQGRSRCGDLKRILDAAWGRPVVLRDYPEDPVKADVAWDEGAVVGLWNYNRITDECTATVVSRDHTYKVEKAKKERAAKSSNEI